MTISDLYYRLLEFMKLTNYADPKNFNLLDTWFQDWALCWESERLGEFLLGCFDVNKSKLLLILIIALRETIQAFLPCLSSRQTIKAPSKSRNQESWRGFLWEVETFSVLQISN